MLMNELSIIDFESFSIPNHAFENRYHNLTKPSLYLPASVTFISGGAA